MNANSQTELHIFDRIVCGVDGSEESLFAVKQADRLKRSEGSLLLVVGMSLAKAVHAGMAAPHAAELLQTEAEQALAEAKELVAAEGKIVNGDPATVLLNEAKSATLLALGSHGRRRAVGIVLGTVATRMLHEAPCSVLISRPARDPETWPQAIVAGTDGSAESEHAVAAARSVAASCGADLRLVSATGDQVDRGAALKVAPELDEREGRAIGVLTTESETADLVVVGSRGLQGLKALGSVSERIAHQASCSVLVVRGAIGGRAGRD
jgi:nucleotide-binding universal stress UspA family protein